MRVYSSTPLQELHDLAGLALAHCRAGHIPESISGETPPPPYGAEDSRLALIGHRFSFYQEHDVNVCVCVCVHVRQPTSAPWPWRPASSRRPTR